MVAQIQQDLGFVKDIRTNASNLLNVADEAPGLQSEWNSCFGGARLGAESFTGEHEGLAKSDIEHGISRQFALVRLRIRF